MNQRILLDLFVRSGLEAYIPVDDYGDQKKVRKNVEKFAELIIREYSYAIMDLTSMPEHVEFAAQYWGVEL